MKEKKLHQSSHTSFELIAAIVLGLMALSCFGFQAFSVSEKTTSLETSLFNMLQFLLTIGFAWFSTRAISRSEFERSLKQFAIGAYRRISDIEKMTQRLQKEILEMLASPETNDKSCLRIVEAIVADTGQIVRSSTDDWADVIGEELISLEKIRRLEHEKREISTYRERAGEQGDVDTKIIEIEEKLDELRSKLPTSLRLSSQENNKEEFSANTAAMWLKEKHKDGAGLLLETRSGREYSSESDPRKINFNQSLFILQSSGGGLNIIDANNNILGRVLNPLPFGYQESASAIELCYGSKEIPVEFVKTLDEYDQKLGTITNLVRIIKEPIYKRSLRRRPRKKQEQVENE